MEDDCIWKQKRKKNAFTVRPKNRYRKFLENTKNNDKKAWKECTFIFMFEKPLSLTKKKRGEREKEKYKQKYQIQGSFFNAIVYNEHATDECWGRLLDGMMYFLCTVDFYGDNVTCVLMLNLCKLLTIQMACFDCVEEGREKRKITEER
jgi:hypothetical protein